MAQVIRTVNDTLMSSFLYEGVLFLARYSGSFSSFDFPEAYDKLRDEKLDEIRVRLAPGTDQGGVRQLGLNIGANVSYGELLKELKRNKDNSRIIPSGRTSFNLNVTIRGNESICYLEKSLRKRMVINTLKSVDHIIAVSNDMKEKVVQEYGVERKKVTVIPNGIDPKKFFRTNKLDAQKQCGLELGSKYILALSRLSPEKGLDSLIKAFLGVSRQDTTLLIVGDGPLKSKLEEMVKDLGISKKVLFFGAVPHEETVKWYNAADVFCLPSLWEGCPNVVIESLASGTPVVASNVGGIPDLIPNDSYGILVPAGDPVSLARALDNALNKEWDREKIAKFGSRNTWDHVAGQIIEVFEKVLR